jgi:hypothetical protein
MKFINILISVLLSLCLVLPVAAKTHKEIIEDGIIDACEAKHTETGNLYYCILSQLYAFNKVIQYYYENMQNPERLDVFDNVWDSCYDEEYGVHDFIVIEKGIRTYLRTLDK